ncbi:MAG: class I SAM-dependent methyltransferase, partial [Nitrosopumilales archaeon]
YQSGLNIISDICDIPEPDESFDAVLCTEVLEHVPNPIDALKELHRLLKINGDLVLTTPFSSLTHYAPYYYHTGFSQYFYEYWLNKIGFRILEIGYNGNYFEWLAQELRRLPSIAESQSNAKVSWIGKKAIQILLIFLGRCSENNTRSENLLSFGLHVHAKKVIS